MRSERRDSVDSEGRRPLSTKVSDNGLVVISGSE